MPTVSSKAEPPPFLGLGGARTALQVGLLLAICVAVVLLTRLWAQDLFFDQTRARAARNSSESG